MEKPIITNSKRIKAIVDDLEDALIHNGYATTIDDTAFKDWADAIRANQQVTSTQQTEINASCLYTGEKPSGYDTALEGYLSGKGLYPTVLKIQGTGSESSDGQKFDCACLYNATAHDESPSQGHLNDMETLIIKDVYSVNMDKLVIDATRTELKKIILINVGVLNNGTDGEIKINGVEELNLSGVIKISDTAGAGTFLEYIDSVKTLSLSSLWEYSETQSSNSLDIYGESLEKFDLGTDYDGRIRVNLSGSTLKDVKIPYVGARDQNYIKTDIEVVSGANITFTNPAFSSSSTDMIPSGTHVTYVRSVGELKYVWFDFIGSGIDSTNGLNMVVNGATIGKFRRGKVNDSLATRISGREVRFLHTIDTNDKHHVKMSVETKVKTKVSMVVDGQGNMVLSITNI